MSQRFTAEAAEGPDVDAPPDYDDSEAPPLHVYWGRVTALLLGLLLAFGLGRVTAPRGVEPSTLEDVRAQLSSARQENERLQQQLLTAQQEAEAPAEDTEEAPAEPADETPGEQPAEPEEDQRTYVVKGGDTLGSIAQRFYEDAAYADVIAEANGLTDPSLLTPGTELIIPDRPEL